MLFEGYAVIGLKEITGRGKGIVKWKGGLGLKGSKKSSGLGRDVGQYFHDRILRAGRGGAGRGGASSADPSHEVPGAVGARGGLATGGQQRPFPDPTPSASQLSRRRAAPGGWKAG